MTTDTTCNTVRLNIEVNSKMYALTCEAHEQERLKEIANIIDDKVRVLSEAHHLPHNSAMLLALLRTEDEILYFTEENDALSRRISELSAQLKQYQQQKEQQNTNIKQDNSTLTEALKGLHQQMNALTSQLNEA